MSLPRLLFVVVTIAMPACSDDEQTRGASREAAGPAATAARAGADMCAEHGVLEAICTKCHPQLAAVFQAKGDWCAEHSFPESVCPTCHPERGGRPTMNIEADDGAPADGLAVNLKDPAAAKVAGIETVIAQQRLNGPEISAVARIVYDASRVAMINARSPGVVREVRADVGTRVVRGAVLAIIESAAIGAERGKLQAARSRLLLADATATRTRDLHGSGIAARKDVELAEQEREAARAEVAAIEAALSVVGGGADAGSTYALTASLGGVVVRRSITVGQTVDSGPTLFEVVDASRMWAEIDVPEQHVGAVKPGQVVNVLVDALPAKTFAAKVDYVAPEIDPRTRTAHVRALLHNDDGSLRANMFGRARIAVGSDHALVMVPRAAVQRAKSVQVVFVEKAPGQYETRRVTLGLEDGDQVEITKGIAAGDKVVTTGSFLLKTETLKDGIGAGCCD